MISEKEMMIVDAVNKLEGDKSNFNNGFSVNQSLVVTNGVGNTFGARVLFDTDGWKKVCTTKELEQCIREMSEGAFVPDAKPEFVYGQDVYVEDPLFSNKELKFGCLTLKGDCAILFTGGGHMVYPLAGISIKPARKQEEIELEEAMKKLVDDYSFVYSHYFKDEAKAKEMFLYMQNRDELAEILLPLEPKQ